MIDLSLPVSHSISFLVLVLHTYLMLAVTPDEMFLN